MRDNGTAPEGGDSPLSDGPLLDLLDALVEDRGRVAAAQALGVNYRTMMNCYDSRWVSRRMREALEKFRNEQGEAAVDGDGETKATAEALERRVAELEEENRELRELVEAQANQLEELDRQVAELEEGERQLGGAGTGIVDDGKQRGWHPPQRETGLPAAGVVTLEKQPDEERAFGQAAPLVEDWRQLRSGAESAGGGVERAQAAVRQWELEISLIGDFNLTLPPETEPLGDTRRQDHLRWRRDALAEARRELARTVRARWLRRAVTFGLWWR